MREENMTETEGRQNPFQHLISECENDPTKLQRRYETHRTARNAQYKNTILCRHFPGWSVDEILRKIQDNEKRRQEDENEDLFVDPRKNLAFYARPPRHIRELIGEIQQELRNIAPTIWFTPPESLHMTTLELANSRTSSEIDTIVSTLLASGILSRLVNYTSSHRCRLIRPIVSFDASAMALSFVPAVEDVDKDPYTYHHLRRDLFDRVADTGVEVVPRYVVPSAHITIARFTTHDGFLLDNAGPDGSGIDRDQLKVVVDQIETINQNLQEKYWSHESPKGQWVVGQEKGLELCGGASWYGNGDKFTVGDGFK